VSSLQKELAAAAADLEKRGEGTSAVPVAHTETSENSQPGTGVDKEALQRALDEATSLRSRLQTAESALAAASQQGGVASVGGEAASPSQAGQVDSLQRELRLSEMKCDALEARNAALQERLQLEQDRNRTSSSSSRDVRVRRCSVMLAASSVVGWMDEA